MWNYKNLLRLDYSVVIVVCFLMMISLLVISSTTTDLNSTDFSFFTHATKNQIKFFLLGWVLFFFFAGFDYRKLIQLSWGFYALILILLLGLFFTTSIHHVHRWYRVPFIGVFFQPSEYAKLIVVLCLATLLEKKKDYELKRINVVFQIFLIVAVPFILILKQPDLGTASVLFPISLAMCYFAKVNERILRLFLVSAFISLMFIFLIFTDILSHEGMRPFFTKILKEYQYERLNPHTYHQKAALTSIALGGIKGSGWHKSTFSSKKWLPAGHTDSVFAAFGEEFGLIGVIILLSLFYWLIYRSFQVVKRTKDNFGKLLSSGIAIYLSMHIIVNVAMMCGFLPISGVPLLLITYGGSSVISTMVALGLLQSIYIKRFMF